MTKLLPAKRFGAILKLSHLSLLVTILGVTNLPSPVANKAVKLTAFPSLVYVAAAMLPQHNQLQSCNLPQRYVAKV
jgi:hypothetical protein